MHKIWLGVALAALIAVPASAQDYNKNLIECMKEAGLHPDHTQKLQSDPAHRTLSMWYLQHDAQAAFINDCVTRKTNLARNPSASRKLRTPQ